MQDLVVVEVHVVIQQSVVVQGFLVADGHGVKPIGHSVVDLDEHAFVSHFPFGDHLDTVTLLWRLVFSDDYLEHLLMVLLLSQVHRADATLLSIGYYDIDLQLIL